MVAKKWTDEEIQFLKNAYPDKNVRASDIAKELVRTKNQFFKKARELKIRKNKEKLPTGYKRCSRCKTILALECFSPNNSWCRECSNEYKKSLRNIDVKEDISSQLAMKTCVRCGETKQIDKFHRRSANKDGYNNTCIKCRSEISEKSVLKNLKERGW